MTENDLFLETAIEAARRAEAVILGHAGKLTGDQVRAKADHDYVTLVDQASEAAILAVLRERFPGHAVFAEESRRDAARDGYTWYVDPLDGTTNYIHGFPVYAVSIALALDGDVILGLILDPARRELFTALRGQGAFLDGRRLSVAPPRPAGEGLVLTGFPFRRKDFTDRYLRLFREVFLKVGDLRRCGSAALDLAYVAAGRAEAFFEAGLGAWDIAAGSLLVREAGGTVTDFEGGGGFLDTGDIVAGTGPMHALVLEAVRDAFAGDLGDGAEKR